MALNTGNKALEPRTRLEYYLNKIANAAETPDLPTPDASGSDTGKVPVVQENGEYALGEVGGSGGGALIIGTTGPASGDPTIYLDKTWSEINEVLANGGVAYVHWTNTGFGTLCPGYFMVTGVCVYSEGEQYDVYVTGDYGTTFYASSESGYPLHSYD